MQCITKHSVSVSVYVMHCGSLNLFTADEG